MNYTLLLLLCGTVAHSFFGPNVRIDHTGSRDICYVPRITLGPRTGSSRPIYVAFEDDSLGYFSGVLFQKSLDGGRTWLPADVFIARPTACDPDITTDREGDIFIVYQDPVSVNCVRSTDGGATWPLRTKVNDDSTKSAGAARIATDSAGNLFCVFFAYRPGCARIWSSVSTDRGATWSRNVRVDDIPDTLYYDCGRPDVFVQPGTNDYLVAASAPYHDGAYINPGPYFYRSTDMGQTFQPGVQVDTSAIEAHVVADAQHVIVDYSGIETRTLYTIPDTWGAPYLIGYSSENTGKLAISADRRVHTVLEVEDTTGISQAYYSFSSDHGVSWSDPELVSADSTKTTGYPDIAADSAGHVYVAWEAGIHCGIWFATNSPADVAEQPAQSPISVQPFVTIVRGVLFLGDCPRTGTVPKTVLLDISGRKVLDLRPGANDVSRQAPGVYFVRAVSREPSAVSCYKVVVTR
ncbi:MAG TPA: sialidase family protein [bacterium]|nr:sialidase family protein [bacterium]